MQICANVAPGNTPPGVQAGSGSAPRTRHPELFVRRPSETEVIARGDRGRGPWWPITLFGAALGDAVLAVVVATLLALVAAIPAELAAHPYRVAVSAAALVAPSTARRMRARSMRLRVIPPPYGQVEEAGTRNSFAWCGRTRRWPAGDLLERVAAEWVATIDVPPPLSPKGLATLVTNIFQGSEIGLFAGVTTDEAPHREVLDPLGRVIERWEGTAASTCH